MCGFYMRPLWRASGADFSTELENGIFSGIDINAGGIIGTEVESDGGADTTR